MNRSTNNTPRLKRKRLRSVTPSDGGHANGNDDYHLHSPLAKRKRLAADRLGYSRLKEGITAYELAETANNGSTLASPRMPIEETVDEGFEDSDDEEEEDEDDFLARELEEEWG
jgi:RNA polymerase II subunit A-like phosphatase